MATKSYEQVMRQIDSLKQEAEKLRQKEVDGVIVRIREAVAFYNLTAEDLGLVKGTKTKAPRGAKRKAAAKEPAVVKFKNDAGGTWGGRGKRPQWLRDAIAAGKSLDDFKV